MSNRNQIQTWLIFTTILSFSTKVIVAKGIINSTQHGTRSTVCNAATGQEYVECYHRQCQPTCQNGHAPCPIDLTICTAGCFCPSDLLWNGEKCVAPENCRDCYCGGSGDVHYKTFDSTYYDFQGNCTYVASRVRKCGEIFIYQVLVTNKACGAGVTCTDAVTVIYDNHVIHMYRDTSTTDVVTTIDEITITNFPLHNSWLILQKVGTSATVYIPSIQLEVNFDYWYSFYIKESSTMFGTKMEGLCGDCNADASDDLQKHDGTITNIVSDFGTSWLVTKMPAGMESGDNCQVLIQDGVGCLPGYPDPDPCDKLLDTSVFGQCHAVIDPAPYVAACKFDLCHGGANFTCQSFKAYVDVCQQQKDICINWRAPVFCPYECPVDRIYKACDDGCKSTCVNDIWVDLPCSLQNVEGCFCPDGLVMQGDKCVEPDACRNCICKGNGDVHYMDFDGTAFDFQGECTYVASRSLDVPNTTFHYQVLVTNSMCFHPGLSCTHAVTILWPDLQAIVLQKSNSIPETVVVSFNGVSLTSFPFTDGDVNIQCDPSYYSTVYIASLQLEVSFYLTSYGMFSIRIPYTRYSPRLEGLCGNCNRNKADEFKTRAGVITSDINEFGKSWLVKTEDIPKEIAYVCKDPGPSPPPTTCPPVPETQDPCLWIMDKTKFGKCHLVVDPKKYISDCQFDLNCNTDPPKCHGVEMYAKACEEAGLCLDWRSDTFCPYTCSRGKVYKPCGSGCEVTCKNYLEFVVNPHDFCQISNKEGCYCPDGLVNKNNECVKPEKCKDCVCGGWGDPHYTNFYNTKFDFQGKCTYIASRDKLIAPATEHLYQVLVTNVACGGGTVTCTVGVIILLSKGQKIFLRRDLSSTKISVKYEDTDVNIFPHIVPGVVQIEGIPTQYITVYIPKLYIEVSYYNSFNGYGLQFLIKLPSNFYTGKLEGLCGDCSYDIMPDPMLTYIETGEVANYGMKWFTKIDGQVIEPECEKFDPPKENILPCEEPSVSEPADFEQCRWIMDKTIFGECHFTVDPKPYVDSCNFDLCHSKDRAAMACNGVEVYARACVIQGICVNWRTDRCPYKCPRGAEYKPCGSGCARTCSNMQEYQNPGFCQLELTEGCYCIDETQVLYKEACNSCRK